MVVEVMAKVTLVEVERWVAATMVVEEMVMEVKEAVGRKVMVEVAGMAAEEEDLVKEATVVDWVVVVMV